MAPLAVRTGIVVAIRALGVYPIGIVAAIRRQLADFVQGPLEVAVLALGMIGLERIRRDSAGHREAAGWRYDEQTEGWNSGPRDRVGLLR